MDGKLKYEPADNIIWTLTTGSDGQYAFIPKGAETYLYATNTNNGIRVGTNDDHFFTLSSGYLKHVATSRYVGIYQSQDWRCYTSINNNISGQEFAPYVKYQKGTVTPTKIFQASLLGAEGDGQNLVVAAATTKASIVITADDDIAWTAIPSEGLSLSDTEGKGSTTLTATFPANTTTASKNYSIMVRTEADGVDNEEYELTIEQDGQTAIDDPVYVLVSSVTSGKKYIIAATVDGVGKAMTPISGNYGYAVATDVEIQDGKIGERAENLEFTFSSVDGGFTIVQPDNRYVAMNGTYNTFNVYAEPQQAYKWAVTANQDGTVDIQNVDKGKHIVYDTGHSNFASYASVKESNIYPGLYEYVGSDTPSTPVDPTFTVPSTLTVEEGKTAKINVTTNTDGAITYTSASTAVATVAADGTVTGVAAGSTTITVAAAATSAFNSASATVAVTVTEVDNTLHTIVVADYASTSFTAGVYSFTAAKAEAATAPAYNANGSDLRIYAKGTLTVSNSKENMTKIVFNLSTQGLRRLAPITASTGTIATQAENDTKVTWTGDASSVVFTVGDKANFGSEGDTANGQLCFTTVDVSPWSDGDVQPKTLSSIEVSGQKTTFTVGDEFTFGGTITAVYSDGSRSTVDVSDVTISGYDMSTAGKQTVRVTYQGKYDDYEITVNAKPDVSGDAWSEVPTLSDLTAGTFVITALSDNKYYAVPSTTINAQTFTCIEGVYNNTDKTFSPAEGSGEFVLTAGPVENSYYIYNPTLEKYLVATASKKFGYVDNTSSDYGYWTFSTVSSGGFSGVFSVKHDNKSQYMRAYNDSVRCYDGTNNNGVYFFKK